MKNDLAIIFCPFPTDVRPSRWSFYRFAIPPPSSILEDKEKNALSFSLSLPLVSSRDTVAQGRKIKRAADPLDYRLIRTALSVTFSGEVHGRENCEYETRGNRCRWTVGRLKGTVARSKQEISLGFDRVFPRVFHYRPLSLYPFFFFFFFSFFFFFFFTLF